MAQPLDHQAAARAGVHIPRDHDHLPRYETDAWPEGDYRLSLDPGRFDVEDTPGRCYPAFGKVHDRGYNAPWRWWVACGDCSRILEARSEAALRAKMAKHVGGAT